MKKAILTLGLFTLVLGSTSFASSKNATASIAENTVITSSDLDGGQSSGGNRKVDFKAGATNDLDGGQSSGGNRKVD